MPIPRALPMVGICVNRIGMIIWRLRQCVYYEYDIRLEYSIYKGY